MRPVKHIKAAGSFLAGLLGPGLRQVALVCMLVVFAAGCAGPLQVAYSPKAPDKSDKIKAPVTVFIEPTKDLREKKAADPRRIGKIGAVVSDMNAGDLVISEDADGLIKRALVSEFTLAGYVVKTEGDAKEADFVLRSGVKDLRLDVGPRDEVSVVITVSLDETVTGKAVWSGDSVEKGDRFAGVSGNSRQTLSWYLSSSVSKAIRSILAEINPRIANTRAAYVPEKLQEAQYEKPAPQGTGRVVISTEPSRSKVYIKDVYFGMTPLNLDIEPGVYEIVVKSKGYKESREKVSVRLGQFTELGFDLEKE
ncbi:MAG: PEGA domain-containing protein [Deltaproteobacteria bacterium]